MKHAAWHAWALNPAKPKHPFRLSLHVASRGEALEWASSIYPSVATWNTHLQSECSVGCPLRR